MWKKILAIMLSLSILFCAVPGVSEEEENHAVEEVNSLPAETVAAAGAEESGNTSEPAAVEAASPVADEPHAAEGITEQAGTETVMNYGGGEDSAFAAVPAAGNDAEESAAQSSNETAGLNDDESVGRAVAETSDSPADGSAGAPEATVAEENGENIADKIAIEGADIAEDEAAEMITGEAHGAAELPDEAAEEAAAEFSDSSVEESIDEVPAEEAENTSDALQAQISINDEEEILEESEEVEDDPLHQEEPSLIVSAAAADPISIAVSQGLTAAMGSNTAEEQSGIETDPIKEETALAIANAGTSGSATRKTRIAILSDIHYISDQLLSEAGKKNVAAVGQIEGRLTTEIGMILDAALKDAAAAQPDALLVCGDLVSNGELSGARTLADKLKSAKGMEGLKSAGIYVVNGNHDINNSYASDFTGETIENGKRVQPEEFTEVFSGLGYGADDHCEGGSHSVYTPSGDNPDEVTNHGGLSYRSDIADGITLIVLDTAIYRTDENETTRYGEAQQTAGYVSDDLLQWAAEQARDASAAGNLVLVMSHHGLIPHYDTDLEEEASWYYDSFRVPNWKKVADTLADAGVTAVLTGHTHANDIAKHVSENNNVLYDIETAALCAYPCAWRTIDIETSGEGKEKSCTISVNTSDIGVEPGEATQSWTFSLSGEESAKTYNEDYNGDLQKYAYDKTGINGDFLKNAAEYMIKDTLYSIVNQEGGIEGYIRKALNVEEGKTVGQWARETLLKELDSRLSDLKITTTVPLLGPVDLQMKKKETELADASFDINLNANGNQENGNMALDLAYLPTAISNLLSSVQKKLETGAWTENNYQSSPLLDDLNKLVRKAVLPALEKPLDENDPDSTAVKMVNESWQAFARGDEGLASEEQKARWEHQEELLGGDKLAGFMGSNLWKEAKAIFSFEDEYPEISEALSTSIVTEGHDKVIRLTYDENSSTLKFLDVAVLQNIKTFYDLFQVPTLLDLSSSISPLLKPVVDKIAGLHHVQTTDTNIPQDNQWQFHSVRFDANGGTVAQGQSLTVEDHRLPGLPEPEVRDGYTFDGWFTAPEGGSPVSAEDDMSETLVLYAHWTPVEKDDEPEQPDLPEEPESKESEARKQDKTDRPASAEVISVKTSPKAGDLHILLGTREQVHAQLRSREKDQAAHTHFCAELAEQLKDGNTTVQMGPWLTLNGEAVQALMGTEAELIIEFTLQEKLYRTRIPAGTDLTKYLQPDGSLCILCLAEVFGYESADPSDKAA